MSGLDYFCFRAARELAHSDAPFYGLLAAAMMRADTFNASRLRAAFPDVWDELQARYDGPGGFIPSDSEPLIRNVAGERADVVLGILAGQRQARAE